jgi:GrpB-like predicted nucleotidyltransferase (UPF0157 family)
MSGTDARAPLSDAEIAANTVGPVEAAGRIELAPYDDAWPSQFEAEARRIRAALGGRALRLEHVGSTSVPGLAAKPILDLVLEVADSVDEPAYVQALEAAGYVLRIREPGWFEHRMFRGEAPRVNLHVYSAGCEEVGRMLLFRDRLRASGEDRAHYEAAKRRLAAADWRFVQNYADAKSGIVAEIMARAEAWAAAGRKG